jgi:hypothetical protein
MYTDPQSITVNAVAQSMPRISSVGTKSVYQKNDLSFTMTISHAVSKDRLRSMVRVDQRAIVPDPLTAVNDWENIAVSLVIDRPLIGFTAAQQDQLLTGFRTWLATATSDKLYGRES